MTDFTNLQTSVLSPWKEWYDDSGINGSNGTSYIGSVLTAEGDYHTGGYIYSQSNSDGYKIYEFKWYAGQGVDGATDFGSKYLAYSENGFTWDTPLNGSSYQFVTGGQIDTLYLGYNPVDDVENAPKENTLTTFDDHESLLVIENFNVVADAAAKIITGNSEADGNTQFATPSWVANGSYYSQVTVNSAVMYGLAFPDSSGTSQNALEYVLDTYLESLGVDITSSSSDIEAALVGTGVSIEYYETAGNYAEGGVVTEALASAAAEDSTLLLAA